MCEVKYGYHVAVFSDNHPTVSWVYQLASKRSVVMLQLLHALALRLKKKGSLPLTPFYISGKHNSMTDILSRSFVSEPKWYCKTDAELLLLFKKNNPLPKKASWTVFQPTKEISMKLLSMLRMEVTTMEDWTRPGKIGKHTGEIGAPSSHLWEWTLSYRIPHFNTRSAACHDL